MKDWMSKKPCNKCEPLKVMPKLATAEDWGEFSKINCKKCEQIKAWRKGPTALTFTKTADLIAELEKRRPCERCEEQWKICNECENCVFAKIKDLSDNFKEAK